MTIKDEKILVLKKAHYLLSDELLFARSHFTAG